MAEKPEHDLDYYMANPDQMPTDPDALERLMGGSTEPNLGKQTEEPVADESSDDEQAEDDATAGESEAAEDTSEGQDEGEESGPILSKDGKHTIPYAVLATERERRQAAERIKQDLEARISELEKRMVSAQAGTPQTPESESETPVDLMAEEDITAMVADFPALEKIIGYTKTLEKKVKTFEDRFKSIEDQEAERAARQQAESRASVQAEVDANPHLRYWQQHDPERWQAALEADSRLSEVPANKALSLAERFEKAVAMVDLVMGPSELPEGWAPKVSTSQPGRKVSTATVAEKVKQAVEKAGSAKPRTLGDIPGGGVPAADPLEELTSLSSAQLANQMMGMSPDQISALLSRVG